MSNLLDIANSLPDGNKSIPAPSTGSKLLDAVNTPDFFKQSAARKPSGLTLFMDPSKFSAIASGLSQSIPEGPSTGQSSYQHQFSADAAVNPGYETAGKVLGTTLLGGLGGVEGGTLPTIAKNAIKSAALADTSQGGASLGQSLFPNNPLAPLIGGLIAPLGAAGALGALKSGGNAVASKLFPQATPETAALNTLSQQYKIPLSMGDIAGQEGKGIGGVERVLEKTPLSGMVKFRAGQQAAIQSKAPQILGTFADSLPPASIEDPQNALQNYLGNAETTARSMATSKYNDFLGKAALADSKVPLINLKSAAQNVINEQSIFPESEQSPATSIAKSITGLPDELGIKAASAWDKKLGSKVNAAQKQFNTGNATKDDLRYYTMLDQSLGGDNGDMAQFAKTQPEDIVGAYNDAKQFYKNNVGPFNEPDIRKIGSDRFDTDTLLTKMVKNNRPQLAQQLMTVLPQEGQSTLKYAVINKLMEGANYGSESKPFSPKLFANAWNKLGDTKGAIFSPQEQSMIDGYTKLINAAPEPMANPRTGAENTGLLGAVALKEFVGTAGIKAAIPLLMGGRALTKMLTQPWGQRLLMTASQSNDTGFLQRLAQSAAMNLKGSANPGTASVIAPRAFAPGISPQAQLPAPQ